MAYDDGHHRPGLKANRLRYGAGLISVRRSNRRCGGHIRYELMQTERGGVYGWLQLTPPFLRLPLS